MQVSGYQKVWLTGTDFFDKYFNVEGSKLSVIRLQKLIRENEGTLNGSFLW